MADRYLSLNKEVLHWAETVTALALCCNAVLCSTNRSAVLAEVRDIHVLLLMPRMVRHVATLVTMDVSVTTCAIGMVMNVLDGGTSLLGIVKLAMSGLTKLSTAGATSFRCLVHLGVTAVIETDICVTACTVCVVNSGFADDLEKFA